MIPENRKYCLKFRGMKKPLAVSADTWEYDENTKVLTVAVTGKKDFRVELELADEAIAAPEKTAAVYALLHKAQISYELKTAIFEAVSAKENPDRILGNLYQMNLDSGLLGAVTEQIICDR